jgi:shikimate kinase
MLPNPDRNLILTGYNGSNVPALGQRIAEQVRLPFVNVDAQVETRAGMPTTAFRDRYGDARLKTLEAEVMQDALLRRGSVIYVSGRSLMIGDYGQRIQQTGPIICLVATLDSVLQRLHLTLGARYHNPGERSLAVGQLKREWAVRKLDGIHELDTTSLAESDISDAVIALWRRV